MYIEYLPNTEVNKFKDWYGNEWTEQPCAIDEFFRREAETKPPHLRNGCAMVSCNCPKCRIIC